jgi:hypothetical protein
MPDPTPQPRHPRFFGPAIMGESGTWLEPGEFCYPKGGTTRRAYAISVSDGTRAVHWCGIPDTAFSVPCKGGGFISMRNGAFIFHPPKDKPCPHTLPQ